MIIFWCQILWKQWYDGMWKDDTQYTRHKMTLIFFQLAISWNTTLSQKLPKTQTLSLLCSDTKCNWSYYLIWKVKTLFNWITLSFICSVLFIIKTLIWLNFFSLTSRITPQHSHFVFFHSIQNTTVLQDVYVTNQHEMGIISVKEPVWCFSPLYYFILFLIN